jgi:hypothetical protein
VENFARLQANQQISEESGSVASKSADFWRFLLRRKQNAGNRRDFSGNGSRMASSEAEG